MSFDASAFTRRRSAGDFSHASVLASTPTVSKGHVSPGSGGSSTFSTFDSVRVVADAERKAVDILLRPSPRVAWRAASSLSGGRDAPPLLHAWPRDAPASPADGAGRPALPLAPPPRRAAKAPALDPTWLDSPVDDGPQRLSASAEDSGRQRWAVSPVIVSHAPLRQPRLHRGDLLDFVPTPGHSPEAGAPSPAIVVHRPGAEANARAVDAAGDEGAALDSDAAPGRTLGVNPVVYARLAGEPAANKQPQEYRGDGNASSQEGRSPAMYIRERDAAQPTPKGHPAGDGEDPQQLRHHYRQQQEQLRLLGLQLEAEREERRELERRFAAEQELRARQERQDLQLLRAELHQLRQEDRGVDPRLAVARELEAERERQQRELRLALDRDEERERLLRARLQQQEVEAQLQRALGEWRLPYGVATADREGPMPKATVSPTRLAVDLLAGVLPGLGEAEARGLSPAAARSLAAEVGRLAERARRGEAEAVGRRFEAEELRARLEEEALRAERWRAQAEALQAEAEEADRLHGAAVEALRHDVLALTEEAAAARLAEGCRLAQTTQHQRASLDWAEREARLLLEAAGMTHLHRLHLQCAAQWPWEWTRHRAKTATATAQSEEWAVQSERLGRLQRQVEETTASLKAAEEERLLLAQGHAREVTDLRAELHRAYEVAEELRSLHGTRSQANQDDPGAEALQQQRLHSLESAFASTQLQLEEEQARWHGQLTEHAGLAQRQELALQRVAEELQGSRAEATRLRQRLAELEHREELAFESAAGQTQRLRADLLAGEGTWRQIWEAEEDYQWRRLLQEARAGALQLSSAVQDRRRWEVRLALMQGAHQEELTRLQRVVEKELLVKLSCEAEGQLALQAKELELQELHGRLEHVSHHAELSLLVGEAEQRRHLTVAELLTRECLALQWEKDGRSPRQPIPDSGNPGGLPALLATVAAEEACGRQQQAEAAVWAWLELARGWREVVTGHEASTTRASADPPAPLAWAVLHAQRCHAVLEAEAAGRARLGAEVATEALELLTCHRHSIQGPATAPQGSRRRASVTDGPPGWASPPHVVAAEEELARERLSGEEGGARLGLQAGWQAALWGVLAAARAALADAVCQRSQTQQALGEWAALATQQRAAVAATEAGQRDSLAGCEAVARRQLAADLAIDLRTAHCLELCQITANAVQTTPDLGGSGPVTPADADRWRGLVEGVLARAEALARTQLSSDWLAGLQAAAWQKSDAEQRAVARAALCRLEAAARAELGAQCEAGWGQCELRQAALLAARDVRAFLGHQAEALCAVEAAARAATEEAAAAAFAGLEGLQAAWLAAEHAAQGGRDREAALSRERDALREERGRLLEEHRALQAEADRLLAELERAREGAAASPRGELWVRSVALLEEARRGKRRLKKEERRQREELLGVPLGRSMDTSMGSVASLSCRDAEAAVFHLRRGDTANSSFDRSLGGLSGPSRSGTLSAELSQRTAATAAAPPSAGATQANGEAVPVQPSTETTPQTVPAGEAANVQRDVREDAYTPPSPPERITNTSLGELLATDIPRQASCDPPEVAIAVSRPPSDVPAAAPPPTPAAAGAPAGGAHAPGPAPATPPTAAATPPCSPELQPLALPAKLARQLRDVAAQEAASRVQVWSEWEEGARLLKYGLVVQQLRAAAACRDSPVSVEAERGAPATTSPATASPAPEAKKGAAPKAPDNDTDDEEQLQVERNLAEVIQKLQSLRPAPAPKAAARTPAGAPDRLEDPTPPGLAQPPQGSAGSPAAAADSPAVTRGASEPRSDGTPLSEERRAAVVALPAKSEASTPPAGHSAGSETASRRASFNKPPALDPALRDGSPTAGSDGQRSDSPPETGAPVAQILELSTPPPLTATVSPPFRSEGRRSFTGRRKSLETVPTPGASDGPPTHTPPKVLSPLERRSPLPEALPFKTRTPLDGVSPPAPARQRPPADQDSPSPRRFTVGAILGLEVTSPLGEPLLKGLAKGRNTKYVPPLKRSEVCRELPSEGSSDEGAEDGDPVGLKGKDTISPLSALGMAKTPTGERRAEHMGGRRGSCPLPTGRTKLSTEDGAAGNLPVLSVSNSSGHLQPAGTISPSMSKSVEISPASSRHSSLAHTPSTSVRRKSEPKARKVDPSRLSADGFGAEAEAEAEVEAVTPKKKLKKKKPKGADEATTPTPRKKKKTPKAKSKTASPGSSPSATEDVAGCNSFPAASDPPDPTP